MNHGDTFRVLSASYFRRHKKIFFGAETTTTTENIRGRAANRKSPLQIGSLLDSGLSTLIIKRVPGHFWGGGVGWIARRVFVGRSAGNLRGSLIVVNGYF